MRLITGLLALAALTSLATLAHADPLRACTRADVSVDESARKVTVRFSNSCEERIGCRVSWNLRCDKDRAQAKSEEVRIDARGDAEVVASASACGDGDWRITPPTWRCDAPSIAIHERAVGDERPSGTRKKRR